MKKIFSILIVLCVYAQAQAPLIGITSVYRNPNNDAFGKIETQMSYVTAVQAAGGVPLVLPTCPDSTVVCEFVRSLDGLVLVGGMDVWPSFYHEKAHPTVDSLSTERFMFEKMLIQQWLESEKPILGICLGSQFTNVVLGGSLYQDVPSQIGTHVIHRQNGGAAHKVVLERSSRLFSIFQQDTLTVNSYHHQAVKQLSPDLNIVARAEDGVIEATEFNNKNRFAVFVQWHPERIELHRKLIFQSFIKAAQ